MQPLALAEQGLVKLLALFVARHAASHQHFRKLAKGGKRRSKFMRYRRDKIGLQPGYGHFAQHGSVDEVASRDQQHRDHHDPGQQEPGAAGQFRRSERLCAADCMDRPRQVRRGCRTQRLLGKGSVGMAENRPPFGVAQREVDIRGFEPSGIQEPGPNEHRRCPVGREARQQQHRTIAGPKGAAAARIHFLPSRRPPFLPKRFRGRGERKPIRVDGLGRRLSQPVPGLIAAGTQIRCE